MKIRYILLVLCFGAMSVFAQNNQEALPTYKEINKANFSNEKIEKLYFDENTREYIEKGIISKKIDVNASHDDGESFLAYSTRYDTEEWLALSKLMLDNGGNINKENENGFTPLMQAIRRCKINQFNLYLNYKPDWKKYDYLTPALMYSGIFRDNITINEDGTVSDYFSDKIGKTLAAFLIENGHDINKKNKNGMSLLHRICALESNNVMKQVYYLIAHGADVNLLTKNKETPIYLHVRNIRYWNPELVEFLFKNGVDPSKETKALSFIWGYAISRLNDPVYSVRNAKKITRLMYEYKVPDAVNQDIGFIIAIGYIPRIKEFLETDTTVNWESKEESYKMLEYAISSDDPEVVKLILTKNPNLEGFDRLSKEPVMLTAVTYGNLEIVKILLEAGADPNDRNSHNYSMTEPPLVAAKTAEMAKLLLEHGADPNLIYDSYWKNTIAMKIAKSYNKEVIREVLKYADFTKTSIQDEGVYEYLPKEEYKELFFEELERRYAGEKFKIKESIPIREAASFSRQEKFVLEKGSTVVVTSIGKYEAYKHGAWLQIRVLKGSKTNSGKVVENVTGWCLSSELVY